MDQADLEHEADMDRTVAKIKKQSFLISTAFKDLLNIKNHLSDNKLRLNLLNRDLVARKA